MQALIFDCDGVLVDTERDGHRVAFNRAFARMGLDTEWSEERYGVLLGTAGGKERMRVHFDEVGWPVAERKRDDFILDLHKLKTAIFMELIDSGALPLRPGVAEKVDAAIGDGCKLAVCSTSNERAVQAVVDILLGPERARHMPVFAGDMVAAKKPDPAVYLLAKDRMDLSPGQCLVVEDSAIGLRAALAAGMRCIVTKSTYTAGENFTGAREVLNDLSEIDWSDCQAICR